DPLIQVEGRPLPLEGLYADVLSWLLRRQHAAQRPLAEREQDGDQDGPEGEECDECPVAPEDLWRGCVVALAEPDDREDQEPLDQEEHERRQAEDDPEQVVDLHALTGRGLMGATRQQDEAGPARYQPPAHSCLANDPFRSRTP